jgi:hypothetical protein
MARAPFPFIEPLLFRLELFIFMSLVELLELDVLVLRFVLLRFPFALFLLLEFVFVPFRLEVVVVRFEFVLVLVLPVFPLVFVFVFCAIAENVPVHIIPAASITKNFLFITILPGSRVKIECE